MISCITFENQINIYEEKMCIYLYIEIIYRENNTFISVGYIYCIRNNCQFFLFLFVMCAHELPCHLTLICSFCISGISKNLLNVVCVHLWWHLLRQFNYKVCGYIQKDVESNTPVLILTRILPFLVKFLQQIPSWLLSPYLLLPIARCIKVFHYLSVAIKNLSFATLA